MAHPDEPQRGLTVPASRDAAVMLALFAVAFAVLLAAYLAITVAGAWFPRADWIELDGIGHCPQLDVPLETAQLILGFTR